MREVHLGEFEHLVLLAIVRLESEAYGVSIRRVIETRGGRTVSLGAVYSALRRLEKKGLIEAFHGRPDPVPGGRAKKYYRLTPDGLGVLDRVHGALARMTDGLSGPASLGS